MTQRTVTGVLVKGAAPVTRTQWWTRYGPVVTSLGAALPRAALDGKEITAYALNDPNAVNLRSADTSLGFSRVRSTAGIERALHRSQGLPWVKTIAADLSAFFFSQSQVLPRITDELAARRRRGRQPTLRRVSRSTGRSQRARWGGTGTRCSPGILGRAGCRR
ncbi:hypothetical protein SMICM17S_06318 [Streptomyces microflavus]